MENQILNQILDELKDLKQGQSKLEAGQANLEAGQSKLEARQAKLEAGQANLEEYVKDLLAGQNKHEKDILRLEGYVKDVKADLLDVKLKQDVALVKLDAVCDHVADLTESHNEVKQRLHHLEAV